MMYLSNVNVIFYGYSVAKFDLECVFRDKRKGIAITGLKKLNWEAGLIAVIKRWLWPNR